MATSRKTINKILQMAHITGGESIAELGSGDGRLAIALAKQGARVTGYELNPLLVYFSRWQARRNGLSDRITIHCHDFWKIDWGQFDILTFYGCNGYMKKIERKIDAECQPDTKIITNTFGLSGKVPLARDGEVFLYQI